MSVSLLRMGNGDLGMFFLRKSGKVDCRLHLVRSTDEGKTWSEPICCINRSGYFVTNNDRIIKLKSGRIIAPANLHPGETFDTIQNASTSHFFISDDDGLSWREAKTSCEIPFPESSSGLQESGIIELADGKLWAWSRTSHGSQFMCYSHDSGETWGIPSHSEFFTSAWSPMSMKEIGESNKIIAVWNPIPAYLTQIVKPGTWRRTPLICAIGDNKGNNFNDIFVLEDDDNIGYCYTAIYFEEKFLLLSYCHGGKAGAPAPLVGTKILKIMFDEIGL